jgi:hypothetical protein
MSQTNCSITTRRWNCPNKFINAELEQAEVTLRCVYLLIDPKSPLTSRGVAEVIASESQLYEVGDWVVANLPWSDYASLPAADLEPLSQGFAGCSARHQIDEELNRALRQRYKPVQMGLQKAGKITDREFLLQVSVARATSQN